MTNKERLESIKDKLNDFQTTVWDLSEDDYMWLVEQAEKLEVLEHKFDDLLEETAKVDGQYTALHREWRDQIKTITRLQVALIEIAEETGTPYATIAQDALDEC